MTERGTRLPEDWKPAQTTLNALRGEFPHFDAAKELPAFIDYFCSIPGARGLKLSWEMTFKNWVRKAVPKVTKQPHHQAYQPAPQGTVTDPRDHIEYWSHRLLLRHVMSRDGIGKELPAAQKVRKDAVAYFLEPVREGDPLATAREFLRQFGAALDKVSRLHESTRIAWRRMLADPDMDKPLPAEMARQL